MLLAMSHGDLMEVSWRILLKLLEISELYIDELTWFNDLN